MNERIRELEVQAGMQYRLGQIVNIDKNGTHTFEEEKVYDTFDTEKFAELIVRECALFMETNTKVNDDGEVVDAPHAWQMIDHFGTKCLTFTFRS